MPRARSESYDLASTPLYHCISRCVRRAFLCGKDDYSGKCFEHRRDWIESRLMQLADIFAIHIYAFAVMSNHLHVVVAINEALALDWDDEEVVERYARLFKNAKSQLEHLSDHARREVIATWRARLHDLSWFMRALNEPIARRANKEDKCTGRFWEGRFKSQPLLDDEALLTCMAYVDLNWVRTGVSTSLDDETHTSICRRLQSADSSKPVPDGLMPFEDQTDEHAIPMSFADYVELLEWTGRCSKADAGQLRGRPPALLQRLKLDPTAWLQTMQDQGLRTVGVLGSVEALDRFATKHGKRWVHGKGHARKLRK
jgi:REP element-mobilizing transposase RayT